MTTETHTVAMTDPQLNNNNNNNNNDGEPKYLHKKFKKMATTEAASVESKREAASEDRIPDPPKKKDIKETKEPAKTEASPEPEGEPTDGRKSGYVCPYCKLSCAKPSVLQKHIRAHTNERPYPCVPCGFAFKTKSNLYKHCRSRAHALKMEGGDPSKVSEDSDISLSDSASNGTGTPPPPPASTPSSVFSTKIVKTGKIYKPKFHTALHNVSNDPEVSSISSNSSNSSTSTPKSNAEQVKEHIDKIITDNQAIVDNVDPRLHKLMQRQQSLVEPKHSEQPLNLSSAEESSQRKRCYSESFAQDIDQPQNPEGSIIKDLLLKTRGQNTDNLETDNFVCPSCKISYTSADNLDAHRRYYCKGALSPRRSEFHLDLDKKEPDFDIKSDYYSTLQPLPSPGPLLGNTRLVDAYTPPAKKQRPESAPTTLRSLEELSKYPRPNSLQMFGGEVRILDNSGETKTMRIEPRQTNSPSDHIVSNSKCITSETSSIVVRSGLHSGGTMVHKPPGTPASTPSSSISLPNTPKMLAPIIPNISTPNIAPTMSCYSYLEPNLNPLTSITAYNPLTLPQAGIASILHGGKVIPYVPGMPGPHTLTGTPTVDISPSIATGDSGYKVIPGIPGLHMVAQPLDLASPVRVPTPNIPGIPGPHSNLQMTTMGQPLDLASPAKEFKLSFKTPSCDGLRPGLTSPKVPSVKVDTPTEKYRGRLPSTPNSELTRAELDRHIKNSVAMKFRSAESPRERREFSYEKSPKVDKAFTYPNGMDNCVNVPNSFGKMRYSPKTVPDNRKRPANWTMTDLDSNRAIVEPPRKSPVPKYESPSHENGRLKANLPEVKAKIIESYGAVNGARLKSDIVPPVITVNLDSSKTEVPNSPSLELIVKPDKSEARSPISCVDTIEEGITKFLRPTSLPLKPGTFTPKRHHGITPTANTLPLISPETPRPKKSYGQLYLNGHAYTYLGLKCSTRVFYCTLNRPQPMYVTQQHGLSMYSNWKICKEAPPDLDMAHYDSRHRPLSYTVAWKKQEDIMTHSSQRPTTPTSPDSGLENDAPEKAKRVKIFDGGFESNEDYIYVRGRGRGRYVCEECGIRCKKPSMLKKHIRTHTDVRPYTCKHCSFSFKTKGNLTKHMKSKAHYKKCVELGVVPVPTSVCDENIDKEAVARLAAGGGNGEDSSEEEDESEGDDSDESGSEEHEAAQSLLSLSQRSASRLPGLIPSGRPTTYPYTMTLPLTSVTTSVISTTTASLSSQVTTVIQSELSHRYYFPSTRSVSEESRSSVIQSSKKDDSDIEIEEIRAPDTRHHLSQPMDLTTKQALQPLSSPILQRGQPSDILTPVSEPVLLQTIVQSMGRLPVQGREWKPDADGHMLQAYLTERHVMDSKIKQQYRVGNSKVDKHTPEKETYMKQHDSFRSRNVEMNSVPTVTYTDPSKMQQSILESRIRSMAKQTSDDIKLEIREKIYQNNANVERRPFDFDPIYRDSRETSSRPNPDRENFERRILSPASVRSSGDHSSLIISRNSPMERSNFSLDLSGRNTPNIEIHTPRNLNLDLATRVTPTSQIKSEIDRSSMFNAMKMMSEIERPRESHTPSQVPRPPSHEMRPPSTELRIQSHSPRSQDLRPPSREIRTPGLEHRPPSRELRPPSQEFRLLNQDLRPPSQEFKPQNHDSKASQEIMSPSAEMRPANPEARPPSRERRLLQEFRPQAQESRSNLDVKSSSTHETSKVMQDIPRSQSVEFRNPDRVEMKHNIDQAKQNMVDSIKHTVARRMVVGGPGFRSPSPPGGNSKPQAEFLQPSNGPAANYVSVTEDGRSVCGICNKVFSKPSQLTLHIHIHYFERPFRCESCAVSFRTKGHLTKHERSVSHHNKVSMTSTFGAATTSNPRPFKCTDCKIAFRIHGHLAKHLRSKMHIMKLECLGKLPFGTYAEMERSGVNLNDIDTTDCDNSLTSLQILAQKLYEKDPSKMGQWEAETAPNQGTSGGETSSDEGEPIPPHPMHPYPPRLSSDSDASRVFHMPILVSEESKPVNEIRHANPQFSQQRLEYGSKEHQNQPRIPGDNTRLEEGADQYKCHVCSVSMRTMNELQVHCFVEHNIEGDSCPSGRGDRCGSEGRENESAQKRANKEETAVAEECKRQKVDDT